MTFHTRLSTVALILTLAIVGGFALSVPRAREVHEVGLAPVASTTPVVTLRDSLKKGVHTLSGSIEAPNACTAVSAEASLTDASSTTPHILLALSMPEDSGVCLQVPTKTSFSTSITAPAGASIEVRVNGTVASTTSS